MHRIRDLIVLHIVVSAVLTIYLRACHCIVAHRE